MVYVNSKDGKLTEEYKKQGLDITEDDMFCGAMYDINKKFTLHESTLGLREKCEED